MEKNEYQALKKAAKQQLGADDKESLSFYAENAEKKAAPFKWIAIGLAALGVPLLIVVIGFPMLMLAAFLYFLGYKKAVKKARAFREHLENDPEFQTQESNA